MCVHDRRVALKRQRPYSIRTRIKTDGSSRNLCASAVRDHIPLEQGLRLLVHPIYIGHTFVRDHIPLEQGLRLLFQFAKLALCRVRDHIPLEQGLRQSSRTSLTDASPVRDHIPLEQGLRHIATIWEELFLAESETIFH